MDLFSVCQFFADGSHEYVRRRVTAREAVEAAHHYCHSVGAKLGTTVRVIITDEADDTNFEWKFGQGVTYPVTAVHHKDGDPTNNDPDNLSIVFAAPRPGPRK
jgi:hypothetical protein